MPLSDPIQLLEAPEAEVGRSEIVDLALWELAVLPKYSMFWNSLKKSDLSNYGLF